MHKIEFLVVGLILAAYGIQAEQVSDWCRGYAEGTTEKVTNATWVKPEGWTTDDISVADGKFTLDLASDAYLDFNAMASKAPDTNVLTRITMVAAFAPETGTKPTSLPSGTKTAFLVDGSGSAKTYCCYVNGSWVALTGATPPDSEDTEVTVLAELSYQDASKPQLRFAIVNDSVVTYLYPSTGASGDWFTLAESAPSPALPAGVSFSGSGVLTSVDAKVQLGVASYAGVKYATVQEAVDAAEKSGQTGVPTVTVLRDNDESVTTTKTIEIATNGKSTGTVTPSSDAVVQVAMPESGTEKGSGTVAIPINVNAKVDQIQVNLSDDSKEVAGKSVEYGNLVVTVKTKDSVISNLQVAGKKLTVNDTLKSYLLTYGTSLEGSYNGKNSSGDFIQTQLNATPKQGSNRTVGQSYALGLTPTQNIVVQPTGSDTDSSYVHIAMPNIKVNSDFTVTYQLQKYNGSTWENQGTAMSDANDISIPVGSGRYRVNPVIAPKN